MESRPKIRIKGGSSSIADFITNELSSIDKSCMKFTQLRKLTLDVEIPRIPSSIFLKISGSFMFLMR